MKLEYAIVTYVIKQLIIKINQNIINLKHLNTKKKMVLLLGNIPNSPDIDKGIYILKDTIKDCRRKFFNSFEYRCVYDINFTNIAKNEDALLTITLGYMEFKSHFYGLTKKIKSTRNNGFINKEIMTLTMKIYSSLPSATYVII